MATVSKCAAGSGSGPTAAGQLYRASVRGDASRVSEILASVDPVASVLEERTAGRTSLFAAALAGHEGVVQLLVGASADVNSKEGTGTGGSRVGWTPLLAAAAEGHTGVVELLLSSGARVDTACGQELQTPLHAAAEEGHAAAAAALIRGGANVDATDAEGSTALVIAAWLGHLEVVNVLLATGANVNLPSNDGRTALFAAAQEGHLAAVRALLAAGAEVNYFRNQGETALYIASHNGECECVESLISAGADASLEDLEGDTPLSLAAKQGHEDVVELLTSQAAPLLTKVHFGTTCSHEQKAAVFRAADAEILALRASIEKQAAAMAQMERNHRDEMAQVMAGLPHMLTCATSNMQLQRDAAVNEARALRSELVTAQQKTRGMSSV
mmetsp:Transcript_35064/g.99406  ORF Transcript_35064/g.99406 Transcript_35064/m.99406 type:complete len:386 (-) Transcript_35064:193-1350(-)|eukprot:CAMPEP_0117663402 /NCGR_PEP_ID=MMETSP0804-20121206/8586_1 /TAXON_ID=1074897 /ORGANISM="Tetraselmis astigmatica, Strain CCMP880" /LENGTH=385 /DNA_ID=CAMNT_0005470403 /DNA_START=159 /DNA_END=1316 /DNA_ORIENTATION=+